jgi:cysteine desulfurase
VSGLPRHYLDHNACTPVDPRVLDRFLAVERRCPANPDSLHAAGRRARAELDDARERAAAALRVAPREICFVSGGTEANNLAVLGAGDPSLPVLLAPCEHASVREPAARRGSLAWKLRPDGSAVVAAPAVPIGLVTLVHGQSEIGTLQPIGAAAACARSCGVPFHVDAAQTLGRVPLDEVLALAQTVSLSVHKAGGLRGSSVLVCRGGANTLRSLLAGGGQEDGLRPGTPSPSLAAATALAIELAVAECAGRAAAMAAARNAFLQAVAARARIEALTPDHSLPNTLLLRCLLVDGRLLLPALDVAGVAASQGAACSSRSPEPPPVLRAIGLDDEAARACVRFSFSHRTTIADAHSAGEIVGTTFARLQEQAVAQKDP